MVEVQRLISVEALDRVELPNGDLVHWVNSGFRCRYLSGEARVNDDESTEVAWFDINAVPDLTAHQARCLALAVTDHPSAWFAPPTNPTDM